MPVEVIHDGLLEIRNAREGAAADALLGDQPEETLDLVEPGGAGRGDVPLEAWVLFKPGLPGRVLVGGIGVDDQRQGEAFGRGAVDGTQERRTS